MGVKGRYTNTAKQREIMKVICEATGRGQTITVTDLKRRLSYGETVSKQALLCSLRFLAKHGMLIVGDRRGSRSADITPTALGYERYKAMLPEPDLGFSIRTE